MGFTYGIDPETDGWIRQKKGMLQKDRNRHFYVIGSTGTGKSRFLQYLIKQDINNGFGFGVIDPHGDLVEDIKGWLYLNLLDVNDLRSKVILIEPTNPNSTVSFNPLEQIKGVPPEEQAGQVVEIFQKIWVNPGGPEWKTF